MSSWFKDLFHRQQVQQEEPLDDDELITNDVAENPYYMLGRNEIHSMLQQLQTMETLLGLHQRDEENACCDSYILKVTDQELYIAPPRRIDVMATFPVGALLTVSGTFNGIDFHFLSRILLHRTLADDKTINYVKLAVPRAIYYPQRRDSFRLEMPDKHYPPVKLVNPDRRTFINGRLVNLGLRGANVQVDTLAFKSLAGVDQGQLLEEQRLLLLLDFHKTYQFNSKVLRVVSLDDNWSIGLQFVLDSRDENMAITRVMFGMEKEQKFIEVEDARHEMH